MGEQIITDTNNNFDKNVSGIESKTKYKTEWVWRNIIIMLLLHMGALYGVFLFGRVQSATLVFAWIIAFLGSMGIQCGGHRLWAHKTYKAKLPLQLFLAFFHILALQNDIYEWSRDHRVHHKGSETDADPHNAKRGFFFAHMGWLLCKKHPDVIALGKKLDMSDLEKDPLVRFQRKFYIPLVLLIWGAFPTYFPHYFWGESLWNAFFVCVTFRYIVTLHLTWLVNSASHLWGNTPYDKNINPVECNVRHLLMGEGFHNYHHTFPWDYSASEFGPLDVFNPATGLIDLMASIGLAYDLKKATNQTVKSKQQKDGDVNYKKQSRLYELFWGYFILTVPFWSICASRLIKS